ncbi:hypothetical protein [Streptomyces sp. NPDC057702]|uniref:hypothetical protein n=1 Tax=unclassified Streptomyces TaxID=2593676 RepID=UPI003673C6A8
MGMRGLQSVKVLGGPAASGRAGTAPPRRGLVSRAGWLSCGAIRVGAIRVGGDAWAGPGTSLFADLTPAP